MSSSASCAISGSGKRGVRAFRHRPAGRNDPRFVARQPLPRLRHRTGRGDLRHLKRPAAPECASRTPCSAAPSPPAPVFDFRAHSCHSAPMETHAFGFRLRANAPEGQKRFPISTCFRLAFKMRAHKFLKQAARPSPANCVFIHLHFSHLRTHSDWQSYILQFVFQHIGVQNYLNPVPGI